MIIGSIYTCFHTYQDIGRYGAFGHPSDVTIIIPDDGATSHLALASDALVAIGLTSCHAVCLVAMANRKNDAFWGLP